jgi:hypothetical protein
VLRCGPYTPSLSGSNDGGLYEIARRADEIEGAECVVEPGRGGDVGGAANSLEAGVEILLVVRSDVTEFVSAYGTDNCQREGDADGRGKLPG